MMEIICTKCDGLGEERVKLDGMNPARNVAWWHFRYDLGYMWRCCTVCAGHGFRPSCNGSVPIVLKKPAQHVR